MITKRKASRSVMMERSRIISHYLSKYFNLFLNRFRFDGDVADEAVAFFMREFWERGTVACFKVEGTEGSTQHVDGLLAFVPYAPVRYNLYNYPIDVSLIALRGATFVPRTPVPVDDFAVIGWIKRNKEGVRPVVQYYAEKLASVEMVLQINLNAQKFPWIVATEPEGEQKARELCDLLLSDNPALFLELSNVDKAKALVSGAPYVIDKLTNYRLELENELREELGLSNLGIGEKKEHLLDSEVSANDEVTAASGDVYLDCLTEFFDRVSEHLGVSIRVSLNQPEPVANPEKNPEGEEGEDDDKVRE